MRTTGHDFLHSCLQRFGLHLSLLTIAIRVILSSDILIDQGALLCFQPTNWKYNNKISSGFPFFTISRRDGADIREFWEIPWKQELKINNIRCTQSAPTSPACRGQPRPINFKRILWPWFLRPYYKYKHLWSWMMISTGETLDAAAAGSSYRSRLCRIVVPVTVPHHSLQKCPGNVSWNCSWSKCGNVYLYNPCVISLILLMC